jgi:hypothetical protein
VKGPEIVLAIVLGAVVVLAVIAALVAGVRCGWIQGSASLRIVPPWKRKESEPRKTKAAAEPVAGTGEVKTLRDVS